MDACIKAARKAPACEEHAAWYAKNPSMRRYLTLNTADRCDACALAVVNAVLVAAREGGWERAAPEAVLRALAAEDETQAPAAVLATAELRRRAKDKTI